MFGSIINSLHPAHRHSRKHRRNIKRMCPELTRIPNSANSIAVTPGFTVAFAKATTDQHFTNFLNGEHKEMMSCTLQPERQIF